ncbi:MAG: hypothetical protein F6K50_49370 [Moorea sp. SIO3I7]|nr:hypothetical protein [Moorena sp. SIO3I7]
MSKPSGHQAQKQDYFQSIQKLIYNHQIAVWGGLWVVMVLAGSIATIGLIDPGPIEEEANNPQPALAQLRASAAKEAVPLSLFGVVAVGCASGCLLLTQALKFSSQKTKLKRPITSSVSSRRRRRNSRRRKATRKQQPVKSVPLLPPSQKRSDDQQTEVTVLPPEPTDQTNAKDETLANMMDMRKRRSLSSLMRDQ